MGVVVRKQKRKEESREKVDVRKVEGGRKRREERGNAQNYI